MNEQDFRVGRQPCAHFQPTDDEMTGQGNVHECWAPFDNGPKCCETHGGLVSFCENCHHDHHTGGYETCRKNNAQPTTAL